MSPEPTRQSVTLADGRTLSYLEAGDPEGIPVLFSIGSPSSALGALGYSFAAERNGLRLIAIDKPGYGESTRVPRRTLLGYGHDVAELADSLGLDRVALAGQSGGGPHAIAAAYVLGERVSTLCLLCSFGPASEPWARDGLNGLMRGTMLLARRAPLLMGAPVWLMKVLFGDAERVERLAKRFEHKLSEAEREAGKGPESPLLVKGIEDAYTNGAGGVRDEFYALGVPWGFQPEDVIAPVDMWHGTIDRSCPIGMARTLAGRFPHATLHELPDRAHVFFGDDLDEAMATLRAKALAPA